MYIVDKLLNTQAEWLPFCLFLLVLFAIPEASMAAAADGKQIFNNQCASCHTIGGGKLVGPDLDGVTSRRDRQWLRRQIKEPDQLIAENDPIALQLLEKSNNVPMVPLGLNDDEVTAVIEFLETTEQQGPVKTGVSPRYLPTILLSVLVLATLTVAGIRAGTKRVEVR